MKASYELARQPNLKPSYLVDQVITSLKNEIHKGIYAPGDRLPSEAEMGRKFGVGRSTIREALRVLSHLGVVETWSGKGSFVAKPDDVAAEAVLDLDEIKDIYSFRYSIEESAAAQAATHRTVKDLTKIKRLLSRAKTFLERGDVRSLVEADTELHISILKAGKCHIAATVYENHRELFGRALQTFIALSGSLGGGRSTNSGRTLHDELISAIEQRDPQAARAQVRRDRREVETRLRLIERASLAGAKTR